MNFDKLDDIKINLDEIRNITAKAQEQKRAEEERKRREEELRRKLDLEKMKNEAFAVIQSIPFKIKQAALEGHNYACIYELDYFKDFDTRSYLNKLDPNHLNLKARMIWDFLEQKGLNPDIYVAYDGMDERSKSHYYIRARW